MTKLSAQSKVIGHYRDHFGYSILIKGDSTFEYTWHFDLESSWTQGTWTIRNDTIFLRMIPIYDTLKVLHDNGNSKDSLIMSVDDKPQRISFEETQYEYTGRQNRKPCPQKLYYRSEKLFRINEQGLLIRKKRKGIWNKEKNVPWFFKEAQN